MHNCCPQRLLDRTTKKKKTKQCIIVVLNVNPETMKVEHFEVKSGCVYQSGQHRMQRSGLCVL